VQNVNWKYFVIVAVVLVGAWAIIKFGAGKLKDVLKLGDIRIGGYNFVVVGLLAMVFSLMMKWIFTKFEVPGLSEIIRSA
jgi:hypothetical protein